MYFSTGDCDLKSSSDRSEYKTDDSDEDEDKIDSDIEAALYSQIHHQENPFYEPIVGETEILQDNDASNDQNNDKDHCLDSELRKDTVSPVMITISDGSDICNADDTNGSDIQFICETKNNTNNENECEVHDDKNHQNKWWKNFLSSTYNDDDGDILLEDEKNSDNDDNYEQTKVLTKLKQSFDLKATSVLLPHKNKKTKKLSATQVKHNGIKCELKHELSDSSEDDNAFKHQKPKTEGKDILINVEPSIITVDLTKDEDMWQLCSKDIYKNKQESRYYNKKDRIICNNCSQRGHISRDCKMPRKLPVCYLCGKVGHQGRHCLNPACTVCLSVGHSRLQCHLRNIVPEKCPLCKMIGHLVEDCPDKWRRYHMTVAPGPIIPGSYFANSTVFCYNCSKKGHFGHECDWERVDEETYPTLPFISEYCEPVIPFSEITSVYKNVKEKRRLMKLARKKQDAVNKSNKQFRKKHKCLQTVTETFFKLASNPSSSVKRKRRKKKKTLFNNTFTDQIDSSLACSSQMSNVASSPPKKKRKRNEKPVLKQTESNQKSKVRKYKKNKTKLQNANIRTELIQGNNTKASNSAAASILTSLIPPDLRFSMNCINLFSGKRS